MAQPSVGVDILEIVPEQIHVAQSGVGNDAQTKHVDEEALNMPR